MRGRMQESLYQTADAGLFLSVAEDTILDSGCGSLFIRQRMQESLYERADAEVSLSNSGCRSHCMRRPMH